MDYAQGYRDGFAAGMAASMSMPMTPSQATEELGKPKKRKVSAYSRAYGRAYKALRRKHTLKSGKLRKGITHKRLVSMAHDKVKRDRNDKKRRRKK